MNNDHQYSINNLIEFGLSMSIAAQMIKVMNDNYPQPQSIFYAIINDKQAGPFAESEVAQLISQKQITTETYMAARHVGMEKSSGNTGDIENCCTDKITDVKT